jgi:NTE family protein
MSPTALPPEPRPSRRRRAPAANQRHPDEPIPAAPPAPDVSAASYDCVALVLQGGGALGSYQCGVYEAMHAGGLRPDWVAGVSIGAINAAIIAGNAPERRVDRLRAFWETICQPLGIGVPIALAVRSLLDASPQIPALHAWANSLGALGALLLGQQGFFHPRLPSPLLFDDGSARATSLYDPTPLRATLQEFIDFDRINAPGGVRLSVGVTSVTSGNLRYFDSSRERIGPDHLMASGALPPAFPAVEIDGEHYWDGGLASNTPLDYVLSAQPRRDSLVLQVDLWSARGGLPRNLGDVLDRQKDVQYSSRTRLNTDTAMQLHRLRHALHALLQMAPPKGLDPVVAQQLRAWACDRVFNIVHLIYEAKPYEEQFKDYAFGLGTMREHWATGRADMQKTLTHPGFFVKPARESSVVTHDVHRAVAAHSSARR